MRLLLTAGCLVLVFAATAAFDVWKARSPEALSAQMAMALGEEQAPPTLSNHDALPRRLSLLLGAAAR